MVTFCAPLDQPALSVLHRSFVEPVSIVGQPTYGRVLFTSHDVRVRHCAFSGWGDGNALTLSHITDCAVSWCRFDNSDDVRTER